VRVTFTLTLVNYAAEGFLYRLSRSKQRDQFGEALVVALRATLRRRGTPLPGGEIVALSERFVHCGTVPCSMESRRPLGLTKRPTTLRLSL
jgi:hypothetical protein